MGSLGSLFKGKEQSRCGRPGRAVDRGFRRGLEEEPLPDLESDVVRELLSAASADGEDPASQRRREDVRVGSEPGACQNSARLKQRGLELHPEKTKVVYCKDANRQETHPNEKFDFLGYTFRPRIAYGRKGKIFCSFSPAMSKKAGQKIRDEIREWKLHRFTEQSIQELARKINPKLRGWFNYYGRFTPSALRPIERHVGQSLVRWACRKYKKLRHHRSRAWAWLMDVIDRQPRLLALWEQQRSRFITIGAV